jgi:hypothetical protein
MTFQGSDLGLGQDVEQGNPASLMNEAANASWQSPASQPPDHRGSWQVSPDLATYTSPQGPHGYQLSPSHTSTLSSNFPGKSLYLRYSPNSYMQRQHTNLFLS